MIMHCFLIACVLCLSASARDDDIVALIVRPPHLQVNPDVRIAEDNAREIEEVNAIIIHRRATQVAAETNHSIYNDYADDGLNVPS